MGLGGERSTRVRSSQTGARCRGNGSHEFMSAWSDERGPAEAKWRFGARLRRARERAGLSIKEVAASGAMNPETLERVEAGQTEPRLRQMLQLAKGVGVSINELVLDLEHPIPIDAEMRGVLAVMLEVPPGSEFASGIALAAKAGLRAGALHPALSRLERVGYLESRWEGDPWLVTGSADPGTDPPAEVARPRLYRLTALGQNLNDYRAQAQAVERRHKLKSS